MGFTLAERAADLSGRFNNVKVTPDLIRKIYKQNLIRKKKIVYDNYKPVVNLERDRKVM